MKGGAGGAGGATNPDIYAQSANAYNKALDATGNAYGVYDELSGYDPSGIGLPATIASKMGAYQNPYENQVINRARGDIQRMTDINLEGVAGEAAAAGAFGGSRHGLVEAETRRGGIDTLGDVSAGLRHSGFTTAAGLAGQDIDNRTDAQKFNKNLDLSGAGIRSGAATGMLNAGSQGGALSRQGFDMGRTIQQDQWNMGAAEQSLMQAIMNGAQELFKGKTGQGAEFFKLLQSAVSGSPLNNQTTTTSSYNPGLFDYLSLAAQTAGSMYNPAAAGV